MSKSRRSTKGFRTMLKGGFLKLIKKVKRQLISSGNLKLQNSETQRLTPAQESGPPDLRLLNLDSVLSRSSRYLSPQISYQASREQLYSPKTEASQYKLQLDMDQHGILSSRVDSYQQKLGHIKLHNAREAHKLL
jgi:hypothetical protein